MTELQHALHFTQDDIEANARGEISQHQRRQLRTKRFFTLFPLIAFIIVSFMMVLFLISGLLSERANTGETSSMPLGIMAMFVILGGLTSRQVVAVWMRQSRMVTQAELRSIQGPVKLRRVNEPKTEPSYVVRIGSQKFSVSPPVYAAFHPGHRYRIFYLSTTQEILSAEELSD